MPWLVDLYKPWQRKRFAVPQGLTGWWQINGRSEKPMHQNTDEDLYYIYNYSLLLDILIIIRTPFASAPGLKTLFYPIPNSPSWLGVRFYQQVFNQWSSQGSRGYGLSRGGVGVIGR